MGYRFETISELLFFLVKQHFHTTSLNTVHGPSISAPPTRWGLSCHELQVWTPSVNFFIFFSLTQLYTTFGNSLDPDQLACVCGAQCSMPVRLGHWQSQTSSVCRERKEKWSDRSAMLGRKTLSPPGAMSYLSGLALRILTSFWRREGSDGMDVECCNGAVKTAFDIQVDERHGPGRPKMTWNSWQRGIAESGSSRLSTLMIDIPVDLVWDLPCVQQASYLEGANWCGCCTCTLIKNLIMMIYEFIVTIRIK